jgi:hypothetical protein
MQSIASIVLLIVRPLTCLFIMPSKSGSLMTSICQDRHTRGRLIGRYQTSHYPNARLVRDCRRAHDHRPPWRGMLLPRACGACAVDSTFPFDRLSPSLSATQQMRRSGAHAQHNGSGSRDPVNCLQGNATYSPPSHKQGRRAGEQSDK